MTRTAVTDWQELSALYERADALEGAALGAWLASLQAASHPLFASLKQMLEARAQVQANGFLGTLPHLPAAKEPVLHEWRTGHRIGAYRLLRHLGAGGMAEVWLAQRDDGAFQRTVAIKLLFRHATSHQRDNFAQRFARERDILASLHHPNIAGLHDAGVTPSGQPWLALEYVEGQPLTAWCDAAQLSVDARVRLFRQVLLAVQHAHANLVIHRDLKPANILVTTQGEVRLLDFGIAKLMEPEGGALAETELTRQAGQPLTVQYASPEQLTGQPLTTACDVYSLGVVLYELLCGERPYVLKVESAAQLEQAILDMEPREPSRRVLSAQAASARGTTVEGLRKRLASDLDAIVLRALAKRPEQRYGSAEALRVDLDRWLAGEAVEARTPSRRYRLRKFVGRHALSVSLGAGAMVALASAASVAVWFGVQARQESARAVASRDFLLDMFKRADPEKTRGASITAGELLESGRKDVSQRLLHQPRLQVELLEGIGAIQSDMGDYAKADSTFAETVRLHLQLNRPRDAAMATTFHAENALRLGDFDRAAGLMAQARRWAKNAAEDAALQARVDLVDAWIASSRGQPEAAKALYEKSLAHASRAYGPNHANTLDALRGVAKSSTALGHVDAALAVHADIAARTQTGSGLAPRDMAGIARERLEVMYSAGRFREAGLVASEALTKCRVDIGPNDDTCRMTQRIAILVFYRMGWIERAQEEVRASMAATSRSTLPEDRMRELNIMTRAMSVGTWRPELPVLRDQLRSFADDMRPSLSKAGQELAILALADSYLLTGEPATAQRLAGKALAAYPDAAIPLATLSWGRTLLGIALMESGRAAAALPMLQQAQEGHQKVLGADHPMAMLFSLNEARALAELGRTTEALNLVARAEPILREAMGSDAPVFERLLSLKAAIVNGELTHVREPPARFGETAFQPRSTSATSRIFS